MSIPKMKKKNLFVSKSIMALASLKSNCPKASNSQTININVDRNSTSQAIPNDQNDQKVIDRDVVNYSEQQILDQNPYADLENNIVKALSIMLDLVESKPLIVDDQIVVPRDILIELLKILTEGEEITINEIIPDSGCLYKVPKYSIIDKLYIIKEGNPLILKYSFPDVVKLFDDHKISIKLVC